MPFSHNLNVYLGPNESFTETVSGVVIAEFFFSAIFIIQNDVNHELYVTVNISIWMHHPE